MIQTSLFRETFKYFAKFPLLAGVKESFNVSTSTLFEEEYNALRDEIDALEVHSLLPGIPDYIFGVDQDLVEKRINAIEGYYLFVDYGSINNERDSFRTRTNNMLIAVTVAFPIKPATYDNVEAILLADQALDFIRQIYYRMEEDSRDKPFLQHLTFPNEITPFFARELQHSTGFTMIFTKSGIGLFE